MILNQCHLHRNIPRAATMTLKPGLSESSTTITAKIMMSSEIELVFRNTFKLF
jgi:undecaprenyl pyrophosphate phosphatase UppP